ncbi:DUF1707 domain-containing protein [Amycolatopsis sp. OK19-0408]|uniref:DUF1707 domain-containing protein n=1 Tax=Amycolatopsis iheyensis TaxID=2945988 RepID=A0A9X2NPG4_9PSEU|nr:DUF1707 domain-containing protein [Amycolatopsis iheyensis]MCR6489180.1 DUF1707 domain-containing protein [Amycolatopsis iheyensis]
MSENAPGTTVPEGIRCSDAEREQIRAALYAAAGEGRLTMDEVEDRLGRLEQVRFRHELAALTADLPAPEPSAPQGWRQILAAAGAALAADVAVLRGRVPEPRPGRRRLLVLLTVLIGLALTAAIIAGAVHGFGADGFEGHELGAIDHGHG